MKQAPTPVQQRDTVFAILLILLIVFFFTGERVALYVLAGVLVLGMTVPRLFSGPARLWFGFSHLLGAVMSKILMGVLFFLLVTPIGLIRRCFGKDALVRKKWKKGDASVFVVREHTYGPEDLRHPY